MDHWKGRDYTKVPVTKADRDRVLAQVREQGKQYGMPQELNIEYPFADTKPPFDFALARPSGEVWLQRPRAKENDPIVYGVVDRSGAGAARWPSRRERRSPDSGKAMSSTAPSGKETASRSVGRFTVK